MKPAWLEKTIFAIGGVLLFGLSAPVLAGGNGKPLEGMKPIVLSHGFLGWGDDGDAGGALGNFSYWGNIGEYLEDEGADVLTVTKTAISSSENRAAEQKEKILLWMAAGGHDKIHVLGHSQGSPDNRYMISNLGMASKVVSATSLNGANQSSPFGAIGGGALPGWLLDALDTVINTLSQFFYGSEQELGAALASLSNMDAFNANTPDHPDVAYYSYGGSILPNILAHPLAILQPITAIGGLATGQGAANDGFVTVYAQKWGQWKGGPDLPWYKDGVDHIQSCNAFGLGEVYYDVEDYYLEMAENMRDSE